MTQAIDRTGAREDEDTVGGIAPHGNFPFFKKRISNRRMTKAFRFRDDLEEETAYTVEEVPGDVAELRLHPGELAKEAAAYEKEGLFHLQMARFPLRFS